MLEKFRNISQGWLAWVIFAIIAIVFTVFGIEGLRVNSQSSDTVKINGQNVPKTIIVGLQRYFPKFNAEESIALNNKLEGLGLFVTDAEVNATLVKLPFLQVNGKFSLEAYQKLMKQNPDFLFALRKMLAMEIKKEQLNYFFQNASQVNLTNQITDTYLKLNESRDITLVDVPYEKFINEIKISDNEISNFYEQNKPSFVAPQKIKLEYLLFNKNDLIKNHPLEDEDIKNYFEQNKAEYTIPERREVAQIVLNANDQDKIHSLEELLKSNPNDFDKIAKEHSQESEINIGEFQKGDMGSEVLDRAVFSIPKVNNVSKPVQSNNKVYFFKLLSLKPEVAPDFSKVSSQIKTELQAEYTNSKFNELRDNLSAELYENDLTLNDPAKKYGLMIYNTDWLTKNTSKVSGENAFTLNENLDKILTAAFEPNVFNNNSNSPVIELKDDTFMVLRILDSKKQYQLGLKEVNKNIIEQLKLLKSQELAKKEALEFNKQLSEGVELKTLLKKYNLQSQNYNNLRWLESINQMNNNLEPATLEVAFSLPKPSLVSNIPVHTFFQDPNGSSQIIILDKVVPANLNTATKSNLESVGILLTRSNFMINNQVFLQNAFS